ncbi:flagellar export chaperone FliS [Marinilactibacillus kalidii]|uniref:flagellar export chaperone FliS n=1 Tax=Marinilactibacillus kalidii TaxID=2820274 RepID=UPI001ABDB68B|nr:flagellar export chaperone FliS [Marinilactibacillus kalidii]
MGYGNASNVYKTNQIQTASPKQLVVLLYEGAIKNIRLAELAIEQGNLEKVNRYLIKAQDIVAELQNSLNHQGGENQIASELENLYEYLLNQLLQANLKKDVEKMVGCRTILSELLEAWASI